MQIEFDGSVNTVTVNGCAISLDVLNVLGGIEPNKLFRFVRNDAGAVAVEAYRVTHECPDGRHSNRVAAILVTGSEASK